MTRYCGKCYHGRIRWPELIQSGDHRPGRQFKCPICNELSGPPAPKPEPKRPDETSSAGIVPPMPVRNVWP